MKNEPLEVIRGSGNVFRDFGHDNADVEQFKALLAAEIIKALDRQQTNRTRSTRPHRDRGGRLFPHSQSLKASDNLGRTSLRTSCSKARQKMTLMS